MPSFLYRPATSHPPQYTPLTFCVCLCALVPRSEDGGGVANAGVGNAVVEADQVLEVPPAHLQLLLNGERNFSPARLLLLLLLLLLLWSFLPFLPFQRLLPRLQYIPLLSMCLFVLLLFLLLSMLHGRELRLVVAIVGGADAQTRTPTRR